MLSQMNGESHDFLENESVKIFDIFNVNIYPADDYETRKRIEPPIAAIMDCKNQHKRVHIRRKQLKGSYPLL